MPAITVMTYALAPGLSPSAFRPISAAVDEVLRDLPGFARRRVFSTDDEQIVDLVWWASADAAREGNAAIMQGGPAFQAWIEAAPPQGFRITDAELADRHGQYHQPDAVVELVHCRLADGVTPDAFRATFGPTSQAVARYPGFGARALAVAPDGSWFDIVLWHDRASALAASQAAESDPVLAPLFSMLDPGSLVVLYGDPLPAA